MKTAHNTSPEKTFHINMSEPMDFTQGLGELLRTFLGLHSRYNRLGSRSLKK